MNNQPLQRVQGHRQFKRQEDKTKKNENSNSRYYSSKANPPKSSQHSNKKAKKKRFFNNSLHIDFQGGRSFGRSFDSGRNESIYNSSSTERKFGSRFSGSKLRKRSGTFALHKSISEMSSIEIA